MTKIGILTYHFADNFGAVFQAYALQRLLASLGHDSEFIDYRPDHVEKGGRFWLPISKQKIKANIVIAYQKYITLRQKLFSSDERHRNFEEFREQNFVTGRQKFKTLKQIQATKLPYDSVVCGSDQIWNSSVQYGIDPAYFLDFGGSQLNRVSFAPSFGNGEVESQHRDEVSRLLKQFDHVSVREKSGVKIVNDLGGREATWVPDPTLMLDNYDDITVASDRENYVMSYVLRSAEMVTDVQRLVEKELGLPLLVPKDRFQKKQSLGIPISPTPSQWLGYIRDADFVVTNSFHGTVFSVIFQKPFISVGLTGKKQGINDRAKSMLDRVGLLDRFVDKFDEDQLKRKIGETIDWTNCNQQLKLWRAESKEFLANAISNV